MGDTVEKRDPDEVVIGAEILDTERGIEVAVAAETEALEEAVADNVQDQAIEEVPVLKVRN